MPGAHTGEQIYYETRKKYKAMPVLQLLGPVIHSSQEHTISLTCIVD